MLWRDLEMKAASEPGGDVWNGSGKGQLSYQGNEEFLTMKVFYQGKEKKKKRKYFITEKTRLTTIKDENFVLPYEWMTGGKSLLQILQK